ncbi:hypothetical protein C0991_012426 [Blastosporella zonata]|nr:hypothetical protein C0991_012426 [Blastosporella zonata]
MGKSAKLHKRVKKTTSSGGSTSNPAAFSSTSHAQAQAAKKRATLKGKTTKNGSGVTDAGVLGGADYVDLMMGGRRKARQEAKKLPPSN